ncbi:hypothetical protein NMG60_11008648 [Bertholletia excelsa]
MIRSLGCSIEFASSSEKVSPYNLSAPSIATREGDVEFNEAVAEVERVEKVGMALAQKLLFLEDNFYSWKISCHLCQFS